VLKVLAEGPVPLDALAARLGAPPSMRDGLEARLRLGVWLGELRGDRRPTACAAAWRAASPTRRTMPRRR